MMKTNKLNLIPENKKGQAGGLAGLPAVAMSFALVAAIFLAAYLVVAGIADSTTNAAADAAANNLTLGLNNIITYAPTWGVLIGVGVLLAIVIGSFAFFGRRQGYF